MATSSLLALIDDIATILDDVALLTKVASQKTAGVLGDDLALNAQQVAGVRAERELPVVWAVAKGSALNKAILVPAALIISAVAPWAVTPLLMLGGLYLCFEGFEKLAHKWFARPGDDARAHRELLHAVSDPNADLLGFENDKVKGAIRTDLILSAEIVAITLGTVADATFATRLLVISIVAAIMTVGVYGFVAAIVKMDDLGLHLSRRPGDTRLASLQKRLGGIILIAAPLLMKLLSVVGTAAMFLVGGGILLHGLPPLLQWTTETAAAAASGLGPMLTGALSLLADALIGISAGGLAAAGYALVNRFRSSVKRAAR